MSNLRRRARWAAALTLLVAVFAGCSTGSDELSTETAGGDADFSYEIPPGAGDALDEGQPLEILPARLDADVGDAIEIRNDDDRGHLVGPFFVGAGETLRQRFSSPGEFIGECTVHPSGQITVVVS